MYQNRRKYKGNCDFSLSWKCQISSDFGVDLGVVSGTLGVILVTAGTYDNLGPSYDPQREPQRKKGFERMFGIP